MSRLKADLSLLMVTLFWGISYLLTDIGLRQIDPMTLNAYRFIGAFAIAVIFSFKRLRGTSAKTLKYAAVIGVVLFFVYTGATYGIKYTSLSNAGFLCGLTVIITPILGMIFFHTKAEKKLIPVLVMVFIGIALLTLNESFKPAKGDILCIMCAFSYAVDLLVTEKAVSDKEVDAYQLGVYQLGFAGAIMTVFSLFMEEQTLPSSADVWVSVLFLSIFCTGVAFIVQSLAQQYTDASRTGIIFAMEPVFAGIVAFVFAGEVLTARAYVGAFLMVAGIFVMEIDLGKVKQR